VIELMNEVGIPEPKSRVDAYPMSSPVASSSA